MNVMELDFPSKIELEHWIETFQERIWTDDLMAELSKAGLIRTASLKDVEKVENFEKLRVSQLSNELDVRYIAQGTLWKLGEVFQLSIELYDNKEQKAQAYEDIKAHFGVDDSQVAYIGDDIIDLAPIKKAALGCAPADAHFSAKDAADYICSNIGGNGAVREVIDVILEEQGLYEELVGFYS